MTSEVEVKKEFTEEQKNFIEADVNASIILTATAGSGKTTVCCERVKFLLSKGISPDKVLFLSFTTSAVKTFKERLNNDAVKVTTIHALCLSMLSKMGKFKKVVDIYDFIRWYQDRYKPHYSASSESKDAFYSIMNNLYEDAQFISSEISAFKLQNADGIKSKIPDWYNEYKKFTIESRSRDFSDMLIEVRNLLKVDKWLRMFKNKYEHIFCDEFQDNSLAQTQILLALNSKTFTIIGDVSQSIYGYSGANSSAVISLLKSRRNCIEMTLSKNFRSTSAIVEYSNDYSNVKAIAHKSSPGKVNKKIILFDQLVNILNTKREVAVLVRTNSVLKDIEKRLLLLKNTNVKYSNYISLKECDDIKKAKQLPSTNRKITELLPVFKTADNIIMFIEQSQNRLSHCITQHKSKGLEFDTCVIVNSVSPEILTLNKITNLSKDKLKKISFDKLSEDEEHQEAMRLHYVSVTRAITEEWFMLHNC